MAIKARQTITIAIERNVSSSVPYYQRNSTKPNKPDDGTTPSGMVSDGWSTTEPSYSSSNSNPVWVTFYTTFSDGTTTCSAVSRYSSYDAAITAYNTAIAADKIVVGNTAPSDTTKIWYHEEQQTFKKWLPAYPPTDPVTYEWRIINDFSDAISAADGKATTANNEVTNAMNIIKALNTTILGEQVIVADTAPTGDTDKLKFWVDTTTMTIKKWNSTENAWIEIMPGSNVMASQTKQSMDIYNLQQENKRVLSFDREEEVAVFKYKWDGNGDPNVKECVTNTIQRFNQNFVFDDTGLTISSNVDNSTRLKLSNRQIEFEQNGETASVWNATGFNCNKITTSEVHLKKEASSAFEFAFVHGTDGSVSFRKITL